METRGDIVIQGLLDRQTDAIINVKCFDTDVDTYIFDPIASLLDWCNKTNKDKNGKN